MSIFRLLCDCIGFDAKDVINIQKRIERKHKDISELLEIFKERKKNITNFYYNLMTDEDGTIQSVFQTDAIEIANYKVYGDYRSFDK